MLILKKSAHLVLVACMLVFAGLVNAIEPVTDLRTVIDVSGSMKNNDPANLRVPALKLLVELMPEGTQSGVWTFGQYVNMNVKQGKVDASWKQKARAEADKIHSRGLYTNIEDALRKASYGWSKPDPAARRNLILLTDGVVDISKDKKLNSLSRQRIVEELLPQLKAARVKVHTVALSKDADHQLLKDVSALTGGWYERVDNAAQLQKVFLRLFEKSAPVDTLPIKANKFQVDKHVKDMTLVLFRSKNAKPAKIITPDNKTISKVKHGKGIRWHQEQGYELVSIKGPLPGEWQLQTEVDPDNRVMVVTNLRLKVAALPNNVLTGDAITVKAHLVEDAKKITRTDFLKLVDFSLSQDQKKGYVFDADMRDDGKKPDDLNQDGVFTAQLQESLKTGKHYLSVKVNGPTFKREFRHLIQVHDSPARLAVEKDIKGDFKLVLTPHSDILQLSTISAQAKLPDGKLVTFAQEKTNEWTATIPENYQDKRAAITLIGTRMDDKPLKLEFDRIISLTKGIQAVSLSEKVAVKPKKVEVKKVEPKQAAPDVEEAITKPEKKAAVANKAESQKAKQKEKLGKDIIKPDEINFPDNEGFSWIFVMSMTLIINLVLIIGGFIGYKYWKKRSVAQDDEEESEMAL